ncbi:hypothetical protein FRC04_006206 [Tulasnella sp. 424]|nr:hypothetical protein FRC04_006206 [Tulasnella sp. 424]KAG8972953.1 hypothetical protein FRC05_009369 [Tulasnella sp. 425]
MPDILSSFTGWTPPETPIRAKRSYSVGPLGTAHEGLSLPYPHDASLDSSIFEPLDSGPYPLHLSLPSLIQQRRFNEAVRVRMMMVDARIPIEPSWEYERMAFRMLVPSLNPFNKARVNSFHIWWSLVPDRRQTIGSRTTALVRRQYLHRIITWLSRLDGPDCPTSALIRFGITAAAKGYAPEVAERLIPHITLWAHPALSAKFLLDFAKAHERYVGTSSQPQHWLLQAIETQKRSGRDAASLAHFLATCHKGGLQLPSRLLRAYSSFLSSEQTTRGEANQTQRTDAPSTQESFERDRYGGTIHHRPAFTPLPAMRREFAIPTPGRFKGSSPKPFHVQRTPSDCKLDHLALLQVVHHLRSRNDPAAAFLCFKSRFETLNIIPLVLADTLNTLVDKLTGDRVVETAHRNTVRHRQWPSTYGASLLWQIALSARKDLSLDFDALYQLFLQHVSQKMVSLKLQLSYKQWTAQDLRRIHSKMPRNLGRVNIYTPWCPPKYAPSVHDFNAFLWGCTGSKDLSGAGSVMPSVALEKVEHILNDMEMVGVQPDRYSLCQLAKACASAGRWRKLVATLDRMHQAGMLEPGQLENAVKRRARWVSVDNAPLGGTKPLLFALAGRLDRAGLGRRADLLRRWAEERKYG